MKCETIMEDLQAYLDNELQDVRRSEVGILIEGGTGGPNALGLVLIHNLTNPEPAASASLQAFAAAPSASGSAPPLNVRPLL